MQDKIKTAGIEIFRSKYKPIKKQLTDIVELYSLFNIEIQNIVLCSLLLLHEDVLQIT